MDHRPHHGGRHRLGTLFPNIRIRIFLQALAQPHHGFAYGSRKCIHRGGGLSPIIRYINRKRRALTHLGNGPGFPCLRLCPLWGIAPKWTLGAVLIAYIGFFLTKSSLETKGFLFAWAVHAILDVVIHTPDHRYRHNPEFLQELIFIRKSEISLAENLSNCKHHLVDLLLKPRWAIPCTHP